MLAIIAFGLLGCKSRKLVCKRAQCGSVVCHRGISVKISAHVHKCEMVCLFLPPSLPLSLPPVLEMGLSESRLASIIVAKALNA